MACLYHINCITLGVGRHVYNATMMLSRGQEFDDKIFGTKAIYCHKVASMSSSLFLGIICEINRSGPKLYTQWMNQRLKGSARAKNVLTVAILHRFCCVYF